MNCATCKYLGKDDTRNNVCFAGNEAFSNGGLNCTQFKIQTAPRKKREDKPTAEGIAYAKKLKEIENKRKDYSLDALLSSAKKLQNEKAFAPYPVSMADGKKLFASIYEAEVLKLKMKVEYPKATKEALNALTAYFMGQSSELNPKKGIYLYGEVGRGKTLVMRSFQIMIKIIEERLSAAEVPFTPRAFKMSNCVSLTKQIDQDKNLSSLNQFYWGNYCFDDLAAEDNLKQWGNEMNVMLDIFTIRYDKIRASRDITHITSNMPFTSERIKERYDYRIESRFNEMFNPVFFDGVDFRKIK